MTVYYEWRKQRAVVPTVPPKLFYDRYWWDELEPVVGQYDFTKIKLDYLTARSRGMEYAFRIRAMGEVGDWRCPYPQDWNNTDFLAGSDNLLQRLGEEYDGKLAYVEIGILGSWGEWADLDDATDFTCRLVIDQHRWAFPRTQRLMKATTRPIAIEYAMRDRAMGWYFCGLGDPYAPVKFDEVPEMLWRPNAVEFKNPAKMQELGYSYTTALQQVQKWGIERVGNGNLPPWDNLTIDDKCALLEIAA